MNKIETAMSFFQAKDNLPPNKNQDPVNKEFKNIILSSIKENYQVDVDQNKQDFIFDEVDRLSSMVDEKKPGIGDLEKLTLLDEMFHVKFTADKLRGSSSNSLDLG